VRGALGFFFGQHSGELRKQLDDGYTGSRSAHRDPHLQSTPSTNFEHLGSAPPNHSGQNTDFNPATLFPQLPVVDNAGSAYVDDGSRVCSPSRKGYHYPVRYEIVDNFTRSTAHTSSSESTRRLQELHPSGGEALTGVTITPLGGFTFNGQWSAIRDGRPASSRETRSRFPARASAQRILPSLTNYQSHARLGVYGQDTFQVTAKLTLNYGLRYLYQPPGCA